MTEEVKRIRRLSENIDTDMIEEKIQKYSLGQKIFWDIYPATVQIAMMAGPGQVQQIDLPAFQLVLGMPTGLIGQPLHLAFSWYFITIPPFKMDEALEDVNAGLPAAMEALRKSKATILSQANGGLQTS
jgi:hypothetical protein